MVMSGSHYHNSYFPSWEMEEEDMEQDMNVDQSINEENMDTHNMIPSSPMDKMELISIDLSCYVVITSPSLTKIDHECFPIVSRLFIEPSCSENYCDLILFSNHEYVLKDILYSHILWEKENNIDHFTQEEEINI
jgi:hypothetical protein